LCVSVAEGALIMPRYFFDFITADFIVPDHTDGRDLADDSAARHYAIANINAILGGKPWKGLNPATSAVEVTDGRGKPFLKVSFRDALLPNVASARAITRAS
jgi:hypothetical protein